MSSKKFALDHRVINSLITVQLVSRATLENFLLQNSRNRSVSRDVVKKWRDPDA